MMSKRSSSRFLILSLRHLAKLLPLRQNLMVAIPKITGQNGATRMRTKIPKLRKITALYLLIEVIVEIKANESKLLVKLGRIFV